MGSAYPTLAVHGALCAAAQIAMQIRLATTVLRAATRAPHVVGLPDERLLSDASAIERPLLGDLALRLLLAARRLIADGLETTEGV